MSVGYTSAVPTPRRAAAADGRRESAAAQNEDGQTRRLHEHAEHDQRLPPGVVGEPAGNELAGTPERRVDGCDDSDLAGARAVRREVERREAPGEGVVEVVHEPSLGARPEHRLPERPVDERLPQEIARPSWP